MECPDCGEPVTEGYGRCGSCGAVVGTDARRGSIRIGDRLLLALGILGVVGVSLALTDLVVRLATTPGLFGFDRPAFLTAFVGFPVLAAAWAAVAYGAHMRAPWRYRLAVVVLAGAVLLNLVGLFELVPDALAGVGLLWPADPIGNTVFSTVSLVSDRLAAALLVDIALVGTLLAILLAGILAGVASTLE